MPNAEEIGCGFANVWLRGKFLRREMDFRLTKTEKHCDV
jgi:hypothetical protein